MHRVAISAVLVMAVGLTGCDLYVEQASIRPDGEIAFLAEADVVCDDQPLNELFGRDPCDVIDEAVAGTSTGDLPFGVELPETVEIESTGEFGRREVQVRWSGPVEDFSSLLVSGVTITSDDGDLSTATFSTNDAPAALLGARPSRWAAGEFRAIAPAVVVEHNGDDIQGRSVIWVIDDDRPDEFTFTWSTEERGIRVWWWIIGAIILGGVLMMIVYLEGQRKERDVRDESG